MDNPISWGVLVIIVFLLFIRSIRTYDENVSKNKNVLLLNSEGFSYYFT